MQPTDPLLLRLIQRNGRGVGNKDTRSYRLPLPFLQALEELAAKKDMWPNHLIIAAALNDKELRALVLKYTETGAKAASPRSSSQPSS